MRIRITIRRTVVYADFEENETSEALIAKMPLTIHQENLHLVKKLPADVTFKVELAE